jgi:rubrerythrin
MELVSENKLGVCKGSVVEEEVNMNFRGECTEVGLYLAMARVAMREGYPEVALVFEKIAWEEAQHAAVFAEMNGLVSESTKANLEKMLKGEQNANKGKREAAVKAKENGIDEAHDFFDVSARDEARHARALKALLDRYFG